MSGDDPVAEPTITPAGGRSVVPAVLLVVADPARRSAWKVAMAGWTSESAVHETVSVREARGRAAVLPNGSLTILDVSGDDPDRSDTRDQITELSLAGCERIVVVERTTVARAVQSALEAGARAHLFGSAGAARQDHGRDATAPSRTAAGGPTPVRRWVTARAVGGRPCRLSPREVEILQRVAFGMPNSEIADELGLSALTVKSHLSRIGRKLGTGDRAQMVLLVLRTGVIQ